MLDRLPFGIAHHMALLPLVCLPFTSKRREAAWWWLAAAFGVSWIADSLAHVVSPDMIGNLYPVSQAAIIGAVFLTRRDAWRFFALLGVTSIAMVLLGGSTGRDVILRAVAWGGVVWIVWPRWELGRLRASLLVSFGLGLACWLAYAKWPGWASWGTYQSIRLLGYLLFCWAASTPHLKLRAR